MNQSAPVLIYRGDPAPHPHNPPAHPDATHRDASPIPRTRMNPMSLPDLAFVSSLGCLASKRSFNGTAINSKTSHLPNTVRRRSHPTANVSMTTFRKYHGIGNDFVLVDNRSRSDPVFSPEQSVQICDRNTGVGADGVIFLLPSQTNSSDFSMRLYNSDGTEPEMCGNGIRCLARFAADLGVESQSPTKYVIDTGAGVIIPEIIPHTPLVRVDMGTPILEPAEVPTTLNTSAANGFVDVLRDVAGRDWTFSCVSMGNPHAITFVTKDVYDEMDAALESVGPDFECNAAFPSRTNTEFVFSQSRTEFDMLVWERGSGRTMACGTGACAVLVAAVLTGRADKDVATTVHLPGGDLTIEWLSSTNHVLMTGPAQLVFEGSFP